MKKIVAVATLTLALLAPTAALPQQTAAKERQLTVLEAINAADALRQLGAYRDREGKEVKVDIKLAGDVMLSVAVDIEQGDRAAKNYQGVVNSLRTQMGLDLPLDKDADSKTKESYAKRLAELQVQVDKAAASSSGGLWARIKFSDLCLSDPPAAPCKVVNVISPSVLAGLLPLIDR